VPAIYHFTDVDNLAGILAAGELRAHRTADCVVDVADGSIKSRRTRIRVPCGPGGRVCDYVPFYFAPRSPMLFRIHRGGVEGVSSDQRRIAYLVSSTEAVLDAGISCVFTDGNAAAAFTDFHDDPEQLSDVVDWPLMRVRYWSNTADDNDRVRRRCAEFLVHEVVPIELIEAVGVYDAAAKSTVSAMVDDAGSSIAVRIRRGRYF
jgi:hypothetical protein